MSTRLLLDARNHYPQIKHHTPPPKNEATTTKPPRREPTQHFRSQPPPVSHHQDEEVTGLLSQSPIVCLAVPSPQSRCGSPFVVHQAGATTATRLLTAHTPTTGVLFVVLLRKEVIQPHLPVRLPCYDFVPIADPTFDGSLPQGVRPPASGVTDFHDVTGGVYKARERIHRSVADLRLLATPTSRGRVADPDPN